MSQKSEQVHGRWKQQRRDIAVSIWVSFLAASVGTFLVFGVLDPAELTSAWSLDWDIGRKLAYSLGFLFLFFISFVSSWLTVFMIRTGPKSGHSTGRGRRPPPETLSPDHENPDLDTRDWL